ncbi:MAG: GNAT family N-acetyltransferase [Pseudonocardiales bacterium]
MAPRREFIEALHPDSYGPPPLPVLPDTFSLLGVTAEAADVELITRWMSKPHVVVFWNQAWSVSRWSEEISEQVNGRHSRPAFVLADGVPVAYVEIYRVALDRLAGCYPFAAGDLGIHIAIGEEARIGRGLGRQILRWIAEGLLRAESGCGRVVAEPNVLNEVALRAFAAAGFRRVGEVELPHKTATLMVYPRDEDDLPLLSGAQ